MIEYRKNTWDEFARVKITNARGENGYRTETDLNAHRLIFEPDRAWSAFDGDHMVGNCVSYPMIMNIPGGSIPIAAVASVSVQATHRRRGINRNMMRLQLEDIYSRNEPLAVLQASESIIYGRYGYGMSSFEDSLSIMKEHGAYAHEYRPSGRLYFCDEDEARTIFPDIYQLAIQNRVGTTVREDNWWQFRFLEPGLKGGDPRSWFVRHVESGINTGYVRYTINRRVLHILELVSSTFEGYSALWRFCLDMDLVDTIEAAHRPVDEELRWMLADPRRLISSSEDKSWLRLVDAKSALENRSFSSEGSLTLRIKDDFLPWNDGVYTLSTDGHNSECVVSEKSPDITLSTSDVAAAYLGGVRFDLLARSGRINEDTPGSIDLLDRLFATDRMPWCIDGW